MVIKPQVGEGILRCRLAEMLKDRLLMCEAVQVLQCIGNCHAWLDERCLRICAAVLPFLQLPENRMAQQTEQSF